MKSKINLKRGLLRIYYVVLFLSIVPILFGGYNAGVYFIAKSEHTQKLEQQNIDRVEIENLIENQEIGWSDLDPYLPRRAELSIRPDGFDPLSIKHEFEGEIAINPWGKEFNVSNMFEVYSFTFRPAEYSSSEIKHFIESAANYKEEYKYFSPSFSSDIDDNMIFQTFIIAGSMIIIPPFLYGLIAKMIIPFLRWIIGGFIDPEK